MLTASAVLAGGRFVRLALLLKPVNRKDGTAKNPKVACRAVDFNRPTLLLKSKNDTYTRWNHAATAGGFIAPRAIAPGFIAPSASLPLAGVKFVPHNTPAFPHPQIL